MNGDMMEYLLIEKMEMILQVFTDIQKVI